MPSIQTFGKWDELGKADKSRRQLRDKLRCKRTSTYNPRKVFDEQSGDFVYVDRQRVYQTSKKQLRNLLAEAVRNTK